MNSLPVADLLRVHAQAYGLLLYLDRQASRHPEVLGPEVIQALSHGQTCAQWLDDHRRELPAAWLPADHDRMAFARMLASFLQVSFVVEQVQLSGALLDARLRSGRRPKPGQFHSLPALCASALKHTLAAAGVRLTLEQARVLARAAAIRDEVHLVAYVYELDRRMKGKSKGPVVHQLWRSLPLDLRKDLNEDSVRQALQRIVRAARERFTDALPA